MANEQLVKEFKEARTRYRELYGKIIDIGVKGVIDPQDLVAAKCGAGDSCHGGSTDIALERLILPLERK